MPLARTEEATGSVLRQGLAGHGETAGPIRIQAAQLSPILANRQ